MHSGYLRAVPCSTFLCLYVYKSFKKFYEIFIKNKDNFIKIIEKKK